jgi:ADP-ribose pyrophosphatase YjhB (NUDIX family)
MKYEDYESRAIRALSFIDPARPMSTAFFNALARLTISNAYEAVYLRSIHRAKLEVLMTKRDNQGVYPNQWHCPGSVQRPRESEEELFSRLAEHEFKTPIVARRLVEIYDLPNEARGHFKLHIYLINLQLGKNHAGNWFDVENLPDNTIWHHRDIVIPKAAEAFGFRKRVIS